MDSHLYYQYFFFTLSFNLFLKSLLEIRNLVQGCKFFFKALPESVSVCF